MPRTAESVRQRIKAVELTDRLQRHALGEQAMSPSQIGATIALLKKVAPDLKSIDIISPAGHQPTITIVNYTDITPDGLPTPNAKLQSLTIPLLPTPDLEFLE